MKVTLTGTVMDGVVVDLTKPQLEVLRFYAGLTGPPQSTRPSLYRPLIDQHLIVPDQTRTSGYVISELGLHALMELERF